MSSSRLLSVSSVGKKFSGASSTLENLGRLDSADGLSVLGSRPNRGSGPSADFLEGVHIPRDRPTERVQSAIESIQVPETPDSPLRSAPRSMACNSDEEVDELLDFEGDQLAQSPQLSRYAVIHSPMRSPPAGSAFNVSQSLSEAASEVIEEELVEDGCDDDVRGSAVPIRPLALSPEFFHGFGRANNRAGTGEPGGRGGGIGLNSPATPATPSIHDDQPQQIMPGLFIGALEAARNTKALRACGLTHILTLGCGMDLPRNNFIQAIKTVEIEDKDREANQLAEQLGDCINFIDNARNAGGRVLVHCLAGRSRSASVVAAYIMVVQKCGVDAALQALRLIRPWICPNEGFLKMLRDFHET